MLNHVLIKASLVAALLLTAPAAGVARDLDKLRDAVKRGDVLPLSVLQEKLRARYPGDIIRVELDDDEDRFTYEFKVLQANGRLYEIEMDAKDGAILDVDDDDDD
ncbi:peptidase [Rhizobiales bacterium RZME27]|uniref:Peptidase n=1 Tax=Endobacterium cereale TaxID=2663029 RepID=A0A6A8ADA4_9HYPH|nr:PepSY domain-containing protein [Endobacterium cereale]MEB2845649.1 PepSY domain-containing protein [Endobacterium cereale]MQY48724.1 peptidase [Endobacterium cereale]